MKIVFCKNNAIWFTKQSHLVYNSILSKKIKVLLYIISNENRNYTNDMKLITKIWPLLWNLIPNLFPYIWTVINSIYNVSSETIFDKPLFQLHLPSILFIMIYIEKKFYNCQSVKHICFKPFPNISVIYSDVTFIIIQIFWITLPLLFLDW